VNLQYLSAVVGCHLRREVIEFAKSNETVNRRVVGSKSHRRSQPSVGAETTRFSCAVPRSVCAVPAVLSKLLHLRFGGDSIPSLPPVL